MADIGFDSTAIAWVLAHNSEQADSFSAQKKKYRKGIIDGERGSNKKTEEDISDLTDTDFPLDLDFDPDDRGNASGGNFLFDFSGENSIYLNYVSGTDPNKYYSVRIFVDHSGDGTEYNGSSRGTYTASGRIGVQFPNGSVSCSGYDSYPYFGEGAWFYSHSHAKNVTGYIYNVKIYKDHLVIYYIDADYSQPGKPYYATSRMSWEGVISQYNLTFVNAGKHPIESN